MNKNGVKSSVGQGRGGSNMVEVIAVDRVIQMCYSDLRSSPLFGRETNQSDQLLAFGAAVIRRDFLARQNSRPHQSICPHLPVAEHGTLLLDIQHLFT